MLFFAAAVRPNALDREVSAIPASALLTHSPYALMDPLRMAAAHHFEQFGITTWVVMIAAQIGILAWFWSSGRSAALRDRLRRRIRSEFFVRFTFGALLALLDKAAAFIPQFFTYRMTRIMDLSSELTRGWLGGWIAGTLIAMVAAGLIAAFVLWLADRTRQWYLYTIGAVIGCTLFVSYFNPYFIAPTYTAYTPLAATGKLASDIAALRARTGNERVPILVEHISRRTHLANAYVSGWGGSQRLVVSDTLIQGATEPEIRFELAREFSWIVSNQALHVALVQGAMIVLGTALAVFIADRVGFRRDDDPVSRLALVGALLGCVYLIALPFYNGYARNLDVGSDSAALKLTGNRTAAIRLEVRRGDQALEPVCPNWLAYWYFDARPTVGRRISLLQGRPGVCSVMRRL